MSDALDSLWQWLVGIGITIIGFFSIRLLTKYDEELGKMREKIHLANNDIHKNDLRNERDISKLRIEFEQFKSHVAEHYVKKGHK